VANVHPLAGLPAPAELLIDPARLEEAFFTKTPQLADPTQRVSFGTSGHRGTPLAGTYTAAHVAAITQAICDHRRREGIDGPLFLGKDTHALSRPSEQVAADVLAANGVTTIVQDGAGFAATPVVSRAILRWNAARTEGVADGIVITPSHNPPEDGGFKYNPPNGGPADTAVTRVIQDRANELLSAGNAGVARARDGLRAPTIHREDLVGAYVGELGDVIDLAVIRDTHVRIGVDPMGGTGLACWEAIAARHRLDVTIVNTVVDPRFGFMTVDHDGRIRMDCSSPYAMANLIGLRDRFDVAIGNDPDADRHGIVSPSAGLLNPNDYLGVAIRYLLEHRPDWPGNAAVGKTVVSSSLIDRVVAAASRRLLEVPVGFKWFAPGLYDGTVCFGGEESAGASFLCRDGRPWSTDKDGVILGLLAAEMTARTGRDPGRHAAEIREQFGTPYYQRIDAPATTAEKARLLALSAADVEAGTLAGEPITATLTRAPGNDAPIGGLKVVSGGGWFAARPSGTEDLYKIYAESLRSQAHLDAILADAQRIVGGALRR
jgi:phosphoglucomutase